MDGYRSELIKIAKDIFSDVNRHIRGLVFKSPDAAGPICTAIQEHNNRNNCLELLKSKYPTVSGKCIVLQCEGGCYFTTLDLELLLEELLIESARALVFTNEQLCENNYVKKIEDNLDRMEKLFQEEVVEYEHVIGLQGIELKDVSAELSFGNLVQPHKMIRELKYDQIFKTEPVKIESIFITSCSAQLQDNTPEVGQNLTNSDITPFDTLAFLLVLTVEDANYKGIKQVWSTDLCPFTGGSFRLNPSQNMNSPFPITLTEVEKINQWAKEIKGKLANIDVARKRIVSAISERTMPEDSLIDVVIAWENLFGVKLEITFQICAALSHILENNVSKREEKFNELKDIYDKRSRIIHGDDFDHRKIQEESNRAIDITIETMKRLLRDHPNLLDMKKSSDRVKKILLEDECRQRDAARAA